MDFNRILDNINSLTIYKKIGQDKILSMVKNILVQEDNLPYMAELVSFLIDEAEKKGFSGNLFKNYICNKLYSDENIFTLYCENNVDVKNTSIYKMAKADIDIISQLADLDLRLLPDAKYMMTAIEEVMNYVSVTNKNQHTNYDNLNIDSIVEFHKRAGCGDVSVYKVFKYDDRKKVLKGVAHPDPITFDRLIGYESQTKTLIDNTEAFIKGYNANNILLVGARGTGKSSSVKALVNKYFEQGLRLVEITKEQIAVLPDILKLLRPRGRRFIVYIDDLSFDENEIQYKYMKSLLEGGSEGKPDNVVFYATSNRRHLIQEKWSDRANGSQEAEIHTTDTLNEKLSLADRFGITITYPKPTPKEYINIVQGIAKQRGITMDSEDLSKEALKWEINQKGMSGRTAVQFINNLSWEMKKDEM